jgi:very-short-patch-repair endonuclease
VFANSLARLGVGDAELLGAMVKRARYLVDRHGGCHARPLRQLASQVAWAVAVLDQQQLAAQLRPLAVACFTQQVALPPQELVQWRQVHTWLADMRLWDQAGLQAVLRPEQMAACTAAWRQQAAHIQDSSTSQMQRDVFRALQKLAQHVLPGLTVHGMEQLDAEDGYAIIDIVADYAGRRLAIEVDGPRHWLRPDQRASGPSLARNRSLETRGYSVVVVDGGKWDTLRVVSGKLRYLMGIICAAVGEEPPSEAWDRCGRWQQLRGHR